MARSHWAVILGSICAAVICRLIPHPPNFTPVAAIALCSGGFLWGQKIWALLVPLLIMGISDLFLGFHPGIWFTYPAMMAVVPLGRSIHPQRFVLTTTKTSALASLLFFAISNFGVWCLGDMYPHTWEGLLVCYGAALPFLGNFFLGTLFFSAVMFPSLWWAHQALGKTAPAPEMEKRVLAG